MPSTDIYLPNIVLTSAPTTANLTTLIPVAVSQSQTSAMGQRTKAMDTESPTSKFLYAIIKQVDLKIVLAFPSTGCDAWKTDIDFVPGRLEHRCAGPRNIEWSRCSHAVLALQGPDRSHQSQEENSKEGGEGIPQGRYVDPNATGDVNALATSDELPIDQPWTGTQSRARGLILSTQPIREMRTRPSRPRRWKPC